MAITARAICEVRYDGSSTNCSGWFYDGLGGTDYTQQASAQITCSANLSATGTTTLTATGSPFSGLTSDLPGNTVRISGGTLTAGLYEIQSDTDADNVVLDRTPGTGSGSTGYIGGAVATIGGVGADIVAAGGSGTQGYGAFVKYNASPIVATSTTANVTNGYWNMTTDGVNDLCPAFCVGYDTTRTLYNTDENRPTIQVGVANLNNGLVNTNGRTHLLIRNLIFDGNRATYSNSRGNNGTGNRTIFERCAYRNFSVTAIACQQCIIINCSFENNEVGISVFSGPVMVHGCYFTGSTTRAHEK